MAIQVSGTEVISNSRELKNITSIDGGTTTTFSNAGFSAPLPSALGVGAYATGRPQNKTDYNAGDTVSNFYATATQAEDNSVYYTTSWQGANGTQQSASGTWRAMGSVHSDGNNGFIGIWARIS